LLSILQLGLRAIHGSFAKGDDDDDCSEVEPKATSSKVVANNMAGEVLHLPFLLINTDEVPQECAK
jgi:hypothetical protein